jgi:hypothetical protein
MNIYLSDTAVQHLNLAISVIFFLLAIAILIFGRPKRFADLPYTRTAFVFWMLQWLGFVLIFFLYNKAPDTVVLLFVDLQTSLALGFFFVYSAGKEFQLLRIIAYILSILTVSTIWNFGFHEFLPTWKSMWIDFSGALSALAFILFGLTFFRRYRLPSLPLMLVTLCYIVLQRPVYTGRFIEGHLHPGWVLALAIGKLCLGLLFYSLYFFVPFTDDALQWTFTRPTTVAGATVGAQSKFPRLRELLLGIIIGLLGHLIGSALARPLPLLFGHR